MRTGIVTLLVVPLVACAAGDTGKPTPSKDDEVSIGYGTRARSALAGATYSITADDIAGFHYSRVEDMIAARVPGVEVRRDANGELVIRIRGSNTLLGSRDPLIVVDGVPTSPRFTSEVLGGINPHDVARIDILRDAASTAIYGLRGANGVILITTKTGR